MALPAWPSTSPRRTAASSASSCSRRRHGGRPRRRAPGDPPTRAAGSTTPADGRADLTPLGFHASVRAGATAPGTSTRYYHRDTTAYVSYFGRVDPQPPAPSSSARPERRRDALAHAGRRGRAGPAVTLRTYRLALVTDPSYANYFGADNVTAAKVTLINRVNQIYEDEIAIRLVLIDDTDKLNLNTAAAGDRRQRPVRRARPASREAQPTVACCSGGSSTATGSCSASSSAPATTTSATSGSASTAAASPASASSAATTRRSGCTGLPTPVGDFYAVDYVAHEMGHQFAGNHTFNGTQSNCSGGNRNAATSVEPGSGSSIMAYAGICRQDNLQPHSDPYWSQRSFDEITAYTSATPARRSTRSRPSSLRDFDTDGDSFTLTYNGVDSAPIVTRGTNYTTAGIKAAIEAIAGWPCGRRPWLRPVACLRRRAAGSARRHRLPGDLHRLRSTERRDSSTCRPRLTSPTGGVAASSARPPRAARPTTAATRHDDRQPRPGRHRAGGRTIPLRTPFALTGRRTDADGDTLTYMWEQNDRGGADGGTGAGQQRARPTARCSGSVRHRRRRVTDDDTLKYHSPGENAGDDRPDPGLPGPGPDRWPATPTPRPAPARAPAAAGHRRARRPGDSSTATRSSCRPGYWVGCNQRPRRCTSGSPRATSSPDGGGVGHADVRARRSPRNAGPFLVTSQDGGRRRSTAARRRRSPGTSPAPTRLRSTPPTCGSRCPPTAAQTFPHVLAGGTPNDGSASVPVPERGDRPRRGSRSKRSATSSSQ